MTRRLFKIMATAFAAGALTLVLASGCGGDDKPKVDITTPNQLQEALSDRTGGDFNSKLDELKKAEMTIEIVQDGKSEGKWSQNGKGSWRWQDSTDTTSYVIYNGDKKKMWIVSGDTAIESSDTSESAAYESFNPALMMSAFAAMTYAPRTGGTEDTWEWQVPGSGKLTIEFKGPDGLVSKVISEDSTSQTDTTEFIYSDVGNVSDSLFELPSSVTVTTTGGITGGYGTSTGSTSTSSSGIGGY